MTKNMNFDTEPRSMLLTETLPSCKQLIEENILRSEVSTSVVKWSEE